MGIIKVENCEGCRDLHKTTCPDADSFECAEDWYCKHKNFKKEKLIESWIGWSSKDQPDDIPCWCPRMAGNEKKGNK